MIAAALSALSLAEQFVIHVLERDELEQDLIVFDVDAEANLPTWFAVACLLLCALRLLSIGAAAATKEVGQDWATHWRWLGALFLLMSIDELAQFHENLGVLQQALQTHGPLYFAWVIPGAVIAGLVGLACIRFIGWLPVRTRLRFMAAAALYLGGALGVEALGGWHAELYGFNNFDHSLIATLEEAMEMAGIIVFLDALLEYEPDAPSTDFFASRSPTL